MSSWLWPPSVQFSLYILVFWSITRCRSHVHGSEGGGGEGGREKECNIGTYRVCSDTCSVFMTYIVCSNVTHMVCSNETVSERRRRMAKAKGVGLRV